MGVKEELRSGFLSASAYISLKGLAKFAVAEIGKIWVVDNELRKLERAVARIRGMIECVEANHCFSGENSNKAWQLWLEDLNTVSYVSGDLLEEVSTLLDDHTKSKLATDASSSLALTTFTIPYEQPSLRSEILSSGELDLPHEIVKLREMLEDLGDEMETLLNFEALKSGKTPKAVTFSGSTSFVDESLVVGREIQKANIVAKLSQVVDSSPSSISIIGMGGLGKTTLAQMVYNDNAVKWRFSRRIWVSISWDFDVTRATRSIIESITRQSCTLMDLQSLQMELQRLISLQKFLLILDDLWTENCTDWEFFFAPLRCGAQGSRIIITTRSRIVSDMVNADSYLLPFLHDRDCWSIIRQRANVDNNVRAEENIDAVGLEMAKKCDGLPLAAKVLGKTLKDIHFKHWDKILKSNLWDLTSCRDDIFSSLALSYYYLPRELKKCFAYCALFPADHKFEEEKLVLLWLAEDLIQPMGERNLLCIGKEYFKDLVGRSFFYSNQEKRKNTYRMHGFFHQMAHFISSDIFLQMEDESLARYPSLENIRHLSFFCNNNLFSDDFVKEFPKCERLRTFLLMCRNDVEAVGQRADYLLSKFDRLRVLDLSRGHINVLSEQVSKLKQLRYLNLSGNLLIEIPEWIDDLFYLETLEFNRCMELTSLPESLKNMRNLRHLQFYGCEGIEHMPSEFAEQVNLQTLSTFVVGQEEGYTIVELKKMAFLRGSLHLFRLENVRDENQIIEANLSKMLWLEELELEWTAHTDTMHAGLVLVNIQFHENVKKLAITGYCGLVFPRNWLNVSGFNLKSIHLKKCSLCLLPTLGHLLFLESLCIEKMPAVETVQTQFFEGFPSLKLLEFRQMVGLRRLSNLEPGCMPSLRVLICKKCLSLVSLPSLGMLGSLTVFKIKGCPSIMSLPEMLPASLQKLDVRKSTILEQGYADAQAEAQQAAAQAQEPQAEDAHAEEAQAEAQEPQADAQQAAAQAREHWQRAIAIPGLRIVVSRPEMNEVAPAEI